MLYCVCGACGEFETPGNWSLLRDFPGVSLRLPENSTHFTPNSVDFRRISTKTRNHPCPSPRASPELRAARRGGCLSARRCGGAQS